MSDVNHKILDDDAEIEFTDLDNPLHSRTFHELRFSPRTRIWMIVVTVMSVVLFLSFTFGNQFYNQFYALVYKPQAAKIRNSTRPSEISLQMVMGGIVYAIDPDNVVYAIRASNGSLIWQSFSPDIDWSTTSDGITYTIEEKGAVIVAQGKNANPLWIYHSPSRLTQPAIVFGNRIFIVANNNNTIAALDTTDGNLLWQYQMPAPIGQSLTVSKEFVYVTSESGTLFTLRASNGTLLWHHQLQPATKVFTTNENIIYATDKSIIALHAKDGSIAWHLSLSSTPVQPLVIAYGTVYVATFDGSVSAFDGDNGSLLWHHQLPAIAYEPIVVSDTTVYIHTSDYAVYTLSAINGSLLWSKPVSNIVTFAVVDKIAYLVTLTNKVEALYSGRYNSLAAAVPFHYHWSINSLQRGDLHRFCFWHCVCGSCQ